MLPLSAALSELAALRREVDERAAALACRHGAALRCALGCTDCCQDELSVFELEAAAITERHAELLERGAPHPVGRCALLGADGSCRAYADRPYLCRTQGLPLRWLEDSKTGDFVELRDVCPKNLAGASITALPDPALWLIGPYEARLAALQKRAFGSLRRVGLRQLFDCRRLSASTERR